MAGIAAPVGGPHQPAAGAAGPGGAGRIRRGPRPDRGILRHRRPRGHQHGRAAPDEISRISAEKRYIIVTLLFLVEGDSNSDRTLAERCDIPESEYWTRLTFGRLIATVPLLNFANVEADAVYLAPGSDEDGFSLEDLHGGGYEYLKMLL